LSKFTTSELAVYYTNVSPPHWGGAVPSHLPVDGPKWRAKFPERSDHLVAPQSSGTCGLMTQQSQELQKYKESTLQTVA